jgi:hypothetical protein
MRKIRGFECSDSELSHFHENQPKVTIRSALCLLKAHQSSRLSQMSTLFLTPGLKLLLLSSEQPEKFD